MALFFFHEVNISNFPLPRGWPFLISSKAHCLFKRILCFSVSMLVSLQNYFQGLMAEEICIIQGARAGQGTLVACNCFCVRFWTCLWLQTSLCACEEARWEEFEGHKTCSVWPLFAEKGCRVTRTRFGPSPGCSLNRPWNAAFFRFVLIGSTSETRQPSSPESTSLLEIFASDTPDFLTHLCEN